MIGDGTKDFISFNIALYDKLKNKKYFPKTCSMNFILKMILKSRIKILQILLYIYII